MWRRAGCALAAAWASAGVLAQPSGPGAEDGGGWESSASLQTWAYATRTKPFLDSLLNPGNSVLGIARTQYLSDTRLDLALKSGDADLVLKPRLVGEIREGAAGSSSKSELYLSQAFGRFRLRPDLTITVGRELLTWGPANFRSPSNPYYYDAGKTRPLEDVPGVDLARIDWSFGRWTSTVGYVQGGRRNDEAWRRSLLLKLAYRGHDFMIGGVLGKSRGKSSFTGGHAQFSVGDAWLLYGELSSTPSSAFANDVVVAQSTSRATGRSTLATVGASYTFEGGASLATEYLHDGRGYGKDVQASYFSRVANVPASGSPATGEAGGDGATRLLGRDYLYVLLQSNLQDPATYWRASWTVNLQDRSRQLLLYGEHSLHPQAVVFASFLWNAGGRSTEFGAVVRSTATVGFKFFLL